MYNVKAANQKQAPWVVFLHFDLVGHQILNRKLDVYGIDCEFMECNNSCLTEGQQSLSISNFVLLIFYNDLLYSH